MRGCCLCADHILCKHKLFAFLSLTISKLKFLSGLKCGFIKLSFVTLIKLDTLQLNIFIISKQNVQNLQAAPYRY